MRIFAVAIELYLFEIELDVGWHLGKIFDVDLAGHVGGNGGVVFGRMAEGFERQLLARHGLGAPGCEGFGHFQIVLRIADDGDRLMVLGCCSQQGDAADVDLLNGCGQRHVRCGHGLLERIEVDHHQIDGDDSVTFQLIQMEFSPSGQDAPVDGRVQRLHSPAQNFGKAGQIFHRDDGQAGIRDLFGGTAAGHQFDPCFAEATGKLNQSGLVGYGQ